MKTSELEGDDLDYWAGRAEYGTDISRSLRVPVEGYEYSVAWEPSTNWLIGGPIIERERIAVWSGEGEWFANHPSADPDIYGDFRFIDVNDDDSYAGLTPLIAAMRAFVASKFGDTVPDEAGA